MAENEIAPVGKRIRCVRTVRNMKRKHLADELPVNDRLIRYYEAGEKKPSRTALKRISEVCHVTMDYFEDKDILVSDLDDKERSEKIIKKYSFNGTELAEWMMDEIRFCTSTNETSEKETDAFIHMVNDAFIKAGIDLELVKKAK